MPDGHDPSLKKILPNGLKKGYVYISQDALTKLDIKTGDPVNINGQSFILGGLFNESQLKAHRYIDGKKVVPPDYVETVRELTGTRSSVTLINDQMNNLDAASFRWTSSELTVIAHNDDVINLGGRVNIMTLYPEKDAE